MQILVKPDEIVSYCAKNFQRLKEEIDIIAEIPDWETQSAEYQTGIVYQICLTVCEESECPSNSNGICLSLDEVLYAGTEQESSEVVDSVVCNAPELEDAYRGFLDWIDVPPCAYETSGQSSGEESDSPPDYEGMVPADESDVQMVEEREDELLTATFDYLCNICGAESLEEIGIDAGMLSEILEEFLDSLQTYFGIFPYRPTIVIDETTGIPYLNCDGMECDVDEDRVPE